MCNRAQLSQMRHHLLSEQFHGPSHFSVLHAAEGEVTPKEFDAGILQVQNFGQALFRSANHGSLIEEMVVAYWQIGSLPSPVLQMFVDLAALLKSPAPLQDIQDPIQRALSILSGLLFGFGHMQLPEKGYRRHRNIMAGLF